MGVGLDPGRFNPCGAPLPVGWQRAGEKLRLGPFEKTPPPQGSGVAKVNILRAVTGPSLHANGP